MELEKKENLKVVLSHLALITTSIIFGSSFFILKDAIDVMPVFFVLAFRFSVGLGVISLIFIKSLLRLKLKTLLHGFIIGIALCGAYSLQTLGLQYTTPGKNAFLTSTYVIMVPFIMWVFFRNRPKLKNLIAAILCIVGIGLISLNGEFKIEIGDILTLCSGILYGLQIVLINKFTVKDEPGQLLFGELLITSLVFWIITLIKKDVPSHIESNSIFPLIYLAFAVTGVAQTLQMIGQKRVSANTTSIIISIEAPVGVLFSVIFYHEELSIKIGFGFALVFISVLVSELDWSFIINKIKNRRKNKELSSENSETIIETNEESQD